MAQRRKRRPRVRRVEFFTTKAMKEFLSIISVGKAIDVEPLTIKNRVTAADMSICLRTRSGLIEGQRHLERKVAVDLENGAHRHIKNVTRTEVNGTIPRGSLVREPQDIVRASGKSRSKSRQNVVGVELLSSPFPAARTRWSRRYKVHSRAQPSARPQFPS